MDIPIPTIECLSDPSDVADFIDSKINSFPDKFRKIANTVISNQYFWTWPASSINSPNAHHAEEGGLALHTAEVMYLASNWTKAIQSIYLPHVELAALFHDFGKIWDYNRNEDNFVYSPHKRLVRHVSRSYFEFMTAAKAAELPVGDTDFISHLILSHHGRQEWGSPVEPLNPEAHILHFADYISMTTNIQRNKR